MSTKIKLVLLFVCIVSIAKAQKRDSLYMDTTGWSKKNYAAAWDSMMRSKIPNLPKDSTALQFSKTITPLDLKTMLYELTSEKCAGRETGYPGQKEAEKYLVSRFKMYGLKPGGKDGSFTQEFNLKEDTLVRCNLEINGKKLEHYKDFYSYINLNHNDSIETDKILFAGYGIEADNYNDYRNLNVKNAIIMIHQGEPKLNDSTYVVSGTSKPSDWSEDWETKLKAATKKGVRAVIVVVNDAKADIEGNHRIKKRPMYFAEDTSTTHYCNVYYISKSAVQEIFKNAGKNYDNFEKKLASSESPQNVKLKTKTILVFKKETVARVSSNVAALIEGTDKKDELVVFSAHYDHLGYHDGLLYPGADDDGSGTVGIMEIAQAFAIAQKKGKGPRRSLLFLCFSGEEKGLLGSEYYANHPLHPLENTVVDLNIDMIGRVDDAHLKNPNYVYIIGDDKISSDLRPISEKANNTYLLMTLDYKFNDDNDPNRYYSRSDHYNFAKKGVPVIFYFNGTHKDYHKSTDTFDKINFGKLLNSTKLVYFTAWDIANRNERIKKNKN
jgi:predicted DNA-binding protein YlxM (UPF0122 family)